MCLLCILYKLLLVTTLSLSPAFFVSRGTDTLVSAPTAFRDQLQRLFLILLCMLLLFCVRVCLSFYVMLLFSSPPRGTVVSFFVCCFLLLLLVLLFFFYQYVVLSIFSVLFTFPCVLWCLFRILFFYCVIIINTFYRHLKYRKSRMRPFVLYDLICFQMLSFITLKS